MVDSAELFEAIAHTVRIKILKILEKQPASFASLKRQLGIDSSGNLDFHLKKLGPLVTVREDGLYGLTEAGIEALQSIAAVETWTEMERHKIRIPTGIPKEALFLSLLELCSTISILGFFALERVFAIEQASFWGYFVSAIILILGVYSGLGILTQQKWSGEATLVKSALVMPMGLFWIFYLTQPAMIEQPFSLVVSYGAFVAAEVVAAIVTLKQPLLEFLGMGKEARRPARAIFSGFLCVFSGVLLVILESMQNLSTKVNTVFSFSMNDTTILCGLAILIGGILILIRSYALGGLLSIIFALYPPPQYGHHAYDLVLDGKHALTGPYGMWIAILFGSLPLVGGILALTNTRRFQNWPVRSFKRNRHR